jgi:hypothetical protein
MLIFKRGVVAALKLQTLSGITQFYKIKKMNSQLNAPPIFPYGTESAMV